MLIKIYEKGTMYYVIEGHKWSISMLSENFQVSKCKVAELMRRIVKRHVRDKNDNVTWQEVEKFIIDYSTEQDKLKSARELELAKEIEQRKIEVITEVIFCHSDREDFPALMKGLAFLIDNKDNEWWFNSRLKTLKAWCDVALNVDIKERPKSSFFKAIA